MKYILHALLVIGLFVLLLALWATTPGYTPTREMKAVALLMVAATLALLYRNRRSL